MIGAVIAAGVKRFILSEYESNSLGVPLEDFKKLMRPKNQVVECLRNQRKV